MPRTPGFQSRWPAALTLAATLFIISTAAHPSAARAQQGGFGGNWCEVGCVVAGLTIIVVPTTLLLAQAIYAADARWFPPGWAVAELVVGLPMLGLGVAGLSQGESPEFGVVFGGLGLWFVTHGIISFIADRPDKRADRAHVRLERWLGPMRFDL